MVMNSSNAMFIYFFTAFVRQSSCSRGWLRCAVQSVFFAITVTSFVLILVVSLKPYTYESRYCQIHGCRVVCDEGLFNIEYENDIIFSVTEAKTGCQWVLLTLNGLVFINSTLPPHWLTRMRSNIHELVIAKGNLRYISPEAFMSQFAGNIRCLMLENIEIETWDPRTLVGLSNLEQLIFKQVSIHVIQKNALEAIDNTIQTLSVTESGSWNPKNLTGSSNFLRLSTVDFSSNVFGNVIRRESFTSLKYCKILFLNSCGIKTIGAGAFDYLKSIKILHLNNNFLVTVPVGLFTSIASNVDLRVSLQDNKWLCKCNLPDLRLLSDRGMMLVDPTCYFPDDWYGKSLRAFYNKCANYAVMYEDDTYLNKTSYIYLNSSCDTDEYNMSPLKVISPIDDFSCPSSLITRVNLKNFTYSMESTKPEIYNNLLKPTFSLSTGGFSMIEITSIQPNRDFGILWHQTKCPNEVYCLNILPNVLRIYNIDFSSSYTFCPLRLSTGYIHEDECIMHDYIYKKHKSSAWILFYILTVACLAIGAVCIYLIYRPCVSLIKETRRILFLKRKNVESLVLPPKIPLKTKLDEQIIQEFNNTQVFVVPRLNKYYFGSNFK